VSFADGVRRLSVVDDSERCETHAVDECEDGEVEIPADLAGWITGDGADAPPVELGPAEGLIWGGGPDSPDGLYHYFETAGQALAGNGWILLLVPGVELTDLGLEG